MYARYVLLWISGRVSLEFVYTLVVENYTRTRPIAIL